MIYVYPKFSSIDFGYLRFGGPGLGNLLFVFARSLKFAEENNYKIIWPTWPQIKIGPWIRHEPDKRFYANLFKPTDDYITGLKKSKLLFSANKFEINNENSNSEIPPLPDESVYMYSAFQMRFKELISHRETIAKKIFEMTIDNHKKCLEHDFSNEINVHVRLGDFSKPSIEQSNKEVFNTQLPINWYVKAISDIKSVVGEGVKFNVFSDGTNEELAPILSISGCERMFWGNAIADIFALSQSKVIIASGSSFSLWARFLGNSSCITFKNQLFEEVCSGENKFEYDYGFDEELSDKVKFLLKTYYIS